MDQDNIPVQDEQAAEDSLPEELVEETEEPSESLESVFTDAPPEDQQQSETGTGEQKEPGYVRRRIEKAVQKVKEQMQAEFDAQMAPLREHMINLQAQELVDSGKVKDLDTARELVRYRQGQPQSAPAPEQPRNDQGQFTKREEPAGDPVTAKHIEMLQHQADQIRAEGGPNVIAEFRNNKNIQQKVMAGEMDFYDVAREMRGARKAPPPVRTPNGASGSDKTMISNMTKEQFARFEKRIDEGVRYSVK